MKIDSEEIIRQILATLFFICITIIQATIPVCGFIIICQDSYKQGWNTPLIFCLIITFMLVAFSTIFCLHILFFDKGNEFNLGSFFNLLKASWFFFKSKKVCPLCENKLSKIFIFYPLNSKFEEISLEKSCDHCNIEYSMDSSKILDFWMPGYRLIGVNNFTGFKLVKANKHGYVVQHIHTFEQFTFKENNIKQSLQRIKKLFIFI